ncbi:MAG: hypothetical protein KAU21_12955, partial [Gammaproteobacteria bacterium]|nr:hypothetical protein [Gammaproteobacteria bacterium]
LAKGKPVSLKIFSNAIHLNTDETKILLDNWTGVSFDKNKNIDAFWGVSTSETTHSFRLGNQTLYTWCAWDLLFIPVIYKQTITAETLCPITQQIIRLRISEKGIEDVTPVTSMITFIKPDLQQLKDNVTNSFCQYIFFVESEKTGEQWQQQNPDGFLLELNQGFELGKGIIQQVFNKAL